MKKKKQTENIFYQHYHEEVKAVQKILTSSVSPKKIHRLRVHIKNIKTFLLLFNETAPGQLKIKKFSVFLRKVFKKSGKAREMQLNYSLAKRSNMRKKAAYEKYTHKKISRSKEALKKIISSFDPKIIRKADRKVNRLCETLSTNYILLQSKQFIAKEIHQVEIMPEENGNEGFHQLRKHLKAIYAVASVLCKTHTADVLKKELAQLKKTEQAIGRWHDNMMFHVSKVHFFKNNNHPSVQKKTLSQHLLQSKTGSRKSILTLLQHIINNLPQEVGRP
ncbi:MAG: CHAD domain-containing protein [Cytophagaceae bacterium]|nr:CHAD domain-containing protein [Cytophagaceae bacterium]